MKEIKEVGGEAGNDSTMEAKAEEVFQRSSTDCLNWGTFFSESSGVSFAASHQWERDCWFWGLVLFYFNRDRA